jgi:pilus assembly protein Flp/PilA
LRTWSGIEGEQAISLKPGNDCSRKGDYIMSKFVTRFLKDESGATAIEYGLIAALIAVVIVGAVGALGTQLQTTFQQVTSGLQGQ